MTVIMPDRRAPAAHPPAIPDDSGDPVDFGARLVQPIAPVSRAADLARADGALADATQALDAFVRSLTAGDADSQTWPERFGAEAKRLRDSYAARVSDGPDRDRFDAAFDLFAKATAVETRRIATGRLIARNRADLDRLLDGYAETAAQAGDPVTGDFALEAGEAAIRHQADAQVLTANEASALARRYRADVAERRARQLVRGDPEAALSALAAPEGGAFADLPEDGRAAMRTEAERRVQDAAETADVAAKLAEADAKTDGIRRRQSFEAAFADALKAGTATSLAIEDGISAGIIDETAAARLKRTLAGDHEARIAHAQQAHAVEDRLTRGEVVDPGDPRDLAAADAWVSASLGTSSDGIAAALADAAGASADLLRHAGERLGFLPPAALRAVELFWHSGEPRLMEVAARAWPDAGSDRAAFRDLVAAGLAPEAAAARIREMRSAGAFATADLGAESLALSAAARSSLFP